MNNSMKYLITTLAILSSHLAFASVTIQDSEVLNSCNTHTQMKFQSLKGQWNVQVNQINEFGTFVKINDNCTPMSKSGFADNGVNRVRTVSADNIVSVSKPLLVGHELSASENFDTSSIFSMVYVPKTGESHSNPTKTCLFYIAAKGPAQPKYEAIEINGA